MMINQNLLLLTYSSLLILSFQFFRTCYAKCPPSSCGLIRNITLMYVNSRKYYVKAIHYQNFTMRLSEISTDSSSCSFPIRSASDYSLINSGQLFNYGRYGYVCGYTYMSLVRCERPLHNSSLFTELTGCEHYSRYTYIKVDRIRVHDMDHMCTLDSVMATSWTYQDSEFLSNASLSEIHQSLLYGFHLSWFDLMCRYNQEGVDPRELIYCHRSNLYYKWERIKGSFRSPQVISLEVRFGMGFLCGIGYLIFKFRRRHLSAYGEIESFLQSDNHLSPIRYSFSDIKRMTRNFREKLGEGGFGSVYKGKLRSGHYLAVKLLGRAKINDKDFINEFGTIGRIHHVNVVQLVGYCAERSKRALILDFMPNGSLDKYIFNPEKASLLDWDMKFKIAVGVARGIQYLHRGCDIKILHFDIKPHNILLDDKFVPKVSDFGLAKLCSVDKDAVTMTAARGTIGYVAPELINRSIGLVSHKADVYSFGMLLMEMAGVNRELRGNKDDSTKYFPDWIYDRINKGEMIGIIEEEDNNVDDENVIGKSVLEKMTIVGLWCIQMNPDNRPSMNKVLEMLEGDVEDLKIPEHPSHLANEDKSRAADSSGSVSQSDFENGSIIEISIA